MVENAIHHQAEIGCDRLNIIPVAQRRVNVIVINDRKAIIRRIRKKRQNVNGIERRTQNIPAEGVQGLQRFLPGFKELIAIGDQHHIFLAERIGMLRALNGLLVIADLFLYLL